MDPKNAGTSVRITAAQYRAAEWALVAENIDTIKLPNKSKLVITRKTTQREIDKLYARLNDYSLSDGIAKRARGSARTAAEGLMLRVKEGWEAHGEVARVLAEDAKAKPEPVVSLGDKPVPSETALKTDSDINVLVEKGKAAQAEYEAQMRKAQSDVQTRLRGARRGAGRNTYRYLTSWPLNTARIIALDKKTGEPVGEKYKLLLAAGWIGLAKIKINDEGEKVPEYVSVPEGSTHAFAGLTPAGVREKTYGERGKPLTF